MMIRMKDEPQMVDFYNELPNFAIVIDKMNQEYDDVWSDNNTLREKVKEYENVSIITEDKHKCIPVLLMIIILTEITILSVYV